MDSPDAVENGPRAMSRSVEAECVSGKVRTGVAMEFLGSTTGGAKPVGMAIEVGRGKFVHSGCLCKRHSVGT